MLCVPTTLIDTFRYRCKNNLSTVGNFPLPWAFSLAVPSVYPTFRQCSRLTLVLKNGLNLASFCLFSFFSHGKYSTNLTINDRSIDGVLGTQTWGGRIVGADESPELWRQPKKQRNLPNKQKQNIFLCDKKVSELKMLVLFKTSIRKEYELQNIFLSSRQFPF